MAEHTTAVDQALGISQSEFEYLMIKLGGHSMDGAKAAPMIAPDDSRPEENLR